MTKKSSIFKTIAGYFRLHPIGVLGWAWVTLIPPIGSLLFLWNYQAMEGLALNSFSNILIFVMMTGMMMGFALLPTTFIALASGYFFGWISLPLLVFSYSLASVLGYHLGKQTNSSLLDILFLNHPKLEKELEARKSKEQDLIFFVRISPVIPFAVSNFLFATMRVSLRKVLIFGILGMFPRTLIVFSTGIFAQSFLSAKDSLGSPIQWAAGLIFLVIGGLGIYFYIAKKPKKAIQ
jgi:uncharacterized membrane protein YdjX (TVP38/TMEM64 family)